MKTNKYSLLIISVIAILTGCTILKNPDGTISVNGNTITPTQVKNNIRIGARIGTKYGVQKDKNVLPYLEIADTVLQAAVQNGTTDINVVSNALSNVSIKEIRNSTYDSIVKDVIDIYNTNLGSTVTNKINQVPYLLPALTGLQQGIDDTVVMFNTNPPTQ